MLLDTAIRATTGVPPSEFRAERAAWWDGEADACHKLDMHDLAAKCRSIAASWRFDCVVVEWERVP